MIRMPSDGAPIPAGVDLPEVELAGLPERLYPVTGALVDRYNRALEWAVGRRTGLTEFHVDRRGESPEIEAELGRNYLQAGMAHRYAIVVSPDQAGAGLIHEEFSFDPRVLDFIYSQYGPGIAVATRVDGLAGEIDDAVRAYTTLEDLLLIHKVHLALHTPSGFLTQGRRLQSLVARLRSDPDLLIRDDSAVPREILDLVREVGDVRSYHLGPLEATLDLDCFSTRLFNGVFIFRGLGTGDPLPVKRPEASAEARKGNRSSDEALRAQLDQIQASFTWPEAAAAGNRPRTVVIHGDSGHQPADGPAVGFIPLAEPERVIGFLIENGFALYDETRLEGALGRLEDEALLGRGLDVMALDPAARLRALHDAPDAVMPSAWHQLREIKRKMGKGYPFDRTVEDSPATVQAMLTAPSSDLPATVVGVVSRLLTCLNPYHYEAMARHNRQDLRRLLELSGPSHRAYIRAVAAGSSQPQRRSS
jgi:hypothetical protein